MNELSSGLKFLEKNWKKLKRLHPILIDLTKEVKISNKYIEQYPGLGPCIRIGMAICKD